MQETQERKIPESGKSPGGGLGNPLWYSYLKNPMNRGACWAMVHRVAKSRTQLKQLSMHADCSYYIFISQYCPKFIFQKMKCVLADSKKKKEKKRKTKSTLIHLQRINICAMLSFSTKEQNTSFHNFFFFFYAFQWPCSCTFSKAFFSWIL